MIGADLNEIAGVVAPEELADERLLLLMGWMNCHLTYGLGIFRIML